MIDFKNDYLIIYEMANNHMGDVNHGIDIIKTFHDVSKNFPFKFAFKFQYRDLDTFIHPDYKGRADIKYVKRFSETRLSENEFITLKKEVENCGFISICTPFDEKSVDMIEKHDYDIIKIASCSFTDWPLLERIALTNKPLIISTAGAKESEIDNVVSFFKHREKIFALMHCVAEYPTLDEHFELNQITYLRNKYEDIPVGYSTHEDPKNYDAVKIAIAKGATLLERHVGIQTEKFSLNAYSSSPDQIKEWLKSIEYTIKISGKKHGRRDIYEKEIDDLDGLKRGVFALSDIRKGERIDSTNIFYAIPNEKGQLLANNFSKYKEFTATSDIEKNKPVVTKNLSINDIRAKVENIINTTKDLLIKSRLSLPNRLDLEISHHYGIDKFEEHGAVIINCFNREYCKKIIVLFPGQNHPSHYHVKKEETFHIVYGKMILDLNGEKKEFREGDFVLVQRNDKHSFGSETGCVFEEISTTHYKGDSFYDDQTILKNDKRKTELTYWFDMNN